MWMHLNKPSATLSYSPPENNASGFNSGANANEKVLNGDLNAGSTVSITTFADEIILAGEAC